MSGVYPISAVLHTETDERAVVIIDVIDGGRLLLVDTHGQVIAADVVDVWVSAHAVNNLEDRAAGV